ncbi:MAG: NUDIX domain-containing protein, partial [Pseudomonadota bacterium]
VTAMMVRSRPGDFAQAMMDLGAGVCTPRNPSCGICPLRRGCRAHREGTVDQFPVRAAKAAKADWQGVAFVVRRADGAILLRRRPEKGLLGGMAEVFGSSWGEAPLEPLAHAPLRADWQEAGAVSHVFTHANLTLTVFAANAGPSTKAPSGGYWQAPEEAGLPTAIKKAVERGLAMLDGAPEAAAAGKAPRATSRKARAR